MNLRHIEPYPQLKRNINKMWLFESNGRAPSEDMKLIVPNGMLKLTIPFQNGVSGKNWEIGIEFNPSFAAILIFIATTAHDC